MSSTPSISLLGTGLMGTPMSRCLLKAGYSLTVWNRTQAKAQELVAAGASVADSPVDAVRSADVVITMLSDGSAVEETLFASGAFDVIRPNTCVIDMSSIAPAEAITHGRRFIERGVRYLDAPVSGGTIGATNGELAIMVGGDPQTFDDMQPVFEAMGRPTLVGPNGCGQLSKLANQVIVAVTIGAVSEAFILAGAGGADRGKVREALQGGFAQSRILSEHGLRMVNRMFEPGGPSHLQLKDLRNAINAAEAMGVTLPITSLVRDLFQRMCESGYGDLDHSGLLVFLEEVSKQDTQ